MESLLTEIDIPRHMANYVFNKKAESVDVIMVTSPRLFEGGAVLVDSFCGAGGSCEPRKRAVNGGLTCLEEEAFCSRLLVFFVYFFLMYRNVICFDVQKLLWSPSTSLRVEEYQLHINRIWKYHYFFPPTVSCVWLPGT